MPDSMVRFLKRLVSVGVVPIRTSTTMTVVLALITVSLVAACGGEQEAREPDSPSESATPIVLEAPLRAGNQVASARDLREARGQVFDWVRGPIDWPDEEETDWIISGEWTLDCNGKCVDTDLENIQFGMALAMVQPDGAQSHAHQLNQFSADSAIHEANGPGSVLAGDGLTIRGDINMVGLGIYNIVIELVDIGQGSAAFFFTLGPPAPFQERAGGVIVESR